MAHDKFSQRFGRRSREANLWGTYLKTGGKYKNLCRKERCTFKGLVGTAVGNTLLGKPRRRWEDILTMLLQGLYKGRGLDLYCSQGQVRGSCEPIMDIRVA